MEEYIEYLYMFCYVEVGLHATVLYCIEIYYGVLLYETL